MLGSFADYLVGYTTNCVARLVRSSNVAFVRTRIPSIAVVSINSLLVFAGTSYVILMSQIVIPLHFTPVMVSLGTFSIFTMSAVLGCKRAVCSSALYVVLGFSGVPVFQGYKTGTQVTMGYLVGYILASYIIGKLAENGKDRKLLSSFGTMLISTPMLYIPGVAWLMYSMNITSVEKGLELGFYPFLIGDLLKILAAGLLMPGLWKIFKWTSRTKNGGE